MRICALTFARLTAFSPEDAAVKTYDTEKLAAKLEELELKKIAERLCAHTPPREIPLEEILPADDSILKGLEEEKELYFLVTDSGAEFAFKGKTYCAPAEKLKKVLENGSIRKITHEYKALCHRLSGMGINISGEFFDTEIAAYVIDPTRARYDIDELFAQYSLPACAASLKELAAEQMKIIEERGQKELLFDIELPLENVLYSMEIYGFKIDKDELMRFSKMLSERINALEGSIYFMAGKEFNINSPKQLGVLLFEDLGLPAIKKTKTGYSTDSGVLEQLRGKHEIIDCIIEYRHLAKLKSTYADAFLPLLDSRNRIRSTLKQSVTATGRISSAEPNLQNIPVRTQIGREIRKMFVAEEGYKLIGADYSQIELRVLAHMSGDETMRNAFVNDDDIHTITASQVFNVPAFLVTDTMRSQAKTVNFGIIYGQSEFSLANELKITRKEAKAYITSYFENYSGVNSYMAKTIDDAKKCGYVTTLFNRRRYIPELSAKNFNLRSFGERAAMNTPIQGTAADIIKIAMVRVYNALKEKCPEARLILQVHDELICEAPEGAAQTVADILKEEMENAVKLSVPLKADVKIGNSWYETK